ncbi:MAG: fluoride efflux transporter CrcB [Actinomycetota bacterium]|nr:fluoride efflux transporter CrcB [Actinomycetota bacterium]
MRFIWMSAFGALGANARYWLEGAISRRFPGAFPLGTFIVNVTGSFLLGFAFVLLTDRFPVSPAIRSGIMIGFIGAYTTFSTLTFETLRLFQDGAVLTGVANAAGSLLIGLVAVYFGTVAGRAL